MRDTVRRIGRVRESAPAEERDADGLAVLPYRRGRAKVPPQRIFEVKVTY